MRVVCCFRAPSWVGKGPHVAVPNRLRVCCHITYGREQNILSRDTGRQRVDAQHRAKLSVYVQTKMASHTLVGSSAHLGQLLLKAHGSFVLCSKGEIQQTDQIVIVLLFQADDLFSHAITPIFIVIVSQ